MAATGERERAVKLRRDLRGAFEQAAGRKQFSVSGDCARPGVYELPLGITVAELLREVGGEGAKAVQIGGAAGQ